jgi:hypothetical protein
MNTKKTTLALLLTSFAAAAITQGCGGGSTRPIAKDGGAGTGGHAAGTTGTGGGGTGGDTSVAGTSGGGTGGGGTGGIATGGTGGVDAAAGGTDGGVAGSDAAATDDAPVEVAPPAQPDPTQAVSWKFNTLADQTWHLTKYGSTPDANAANNLALISTIAWDGTNDADSLTTSGSLKGTVPFTAVGDRVDFQAFSVGAGMYNWLGYTISAKVKVVSGGNIKAGCPLHAWLYLSQAPDYNTALAGPTDLVTGQWVTLTYDTANFNYDIAHISQMGIQITTGDACAGTAPDGGVDAAADGGTDAVVVADGGTDATATDGAIDAVADGGAGTDAASDGAADGGVADAGDAAVVVPPTATTAVILIDNVIVKLK